MAYGYNGANAQLSATDGGTIFEQARRYETASTVFQAAETFEVGENEAFGINIYVHAYDTTNLTAQASGTAHGCFSRNGAAPPTFGGTGTGLTISVRQTGLAIGLRLLVVGNNVEFQISSPVTNLTRFTARIELIKP